MLNTEQLNERLNKTVLLGDGAMGTMIYQQGVFLNACFDELNLSRPQLIEQIHKEYIEAGSDFIETNTFGANRLKLTRYGLADQVKQINQAAVEIARRAVADSQTLIAGAVGPLGVDVAPFGKTTAEQAAEVFSEQTETLINAGVDFLLFETFTNPQELIIAVEAAQKIAPIAVIAQITTNEFHETAYGTALVDAIRPLSEHKAVSVVGLNCATGPALMLSSLEQVRSATNKPISLQPNAGMPRQIEGRKIYMCTPEYMAEYAKRFLEKGVRVIGGCCGTTPAHIKQMVKAVRALDRATLKAAPRITVNKTDQTASEPVEAIPLAQRSNWGRKLVAGEKLTTIEITPPRSTDLTGILEKARLCAEHGIDAINIPDGPRASSRLSPLVTAIKIKLETDIEPMIHVCCRDRNILGIQSDLLGAYTLGLRNVLLITGDPPKTGEYPDATGVFDIESIGLTALARNLNHGLDLAGNALSEPLALTLGVGANPVAADMEREIDRFRLKVQAGAEYAITQPVFDAEMLIQFMDATKDSEIPFIAGIWPFTSFKNAEFMAHEVPGVVVPDSLLKRMEGCKTREEARKEGIAIAQEMIEAISSRVAGFAVSAPFGNIKIPLAVLGKIESETI